MSAASETFGVAEVLRCGSALRSIGDGATSVEEVASAVVGHIRDHFVDKGSGRFALPLVRFYITRRCSDLEAALQDFSRAAATDVATGLDVVCLTLLASVGEEPAWNDRRASVAHKAIPLPSVEALRRSPMVAQLVEQLGIDPHHVVAPDPALFLDLSERTYNVFFLSEARDNPHVPAQENFVIPYGIRSVLGFGGVLPDGALFAVVLFSALPIPGTVVDAFADMALSVKLAVIPHVGGATFADQPPPPPARGDQADQHVKRLESLNRTLAQLLDVRAAIVEAESLRIEQELTKVEERAAELAASQAALALSEARKSAIVEGALDCIIGMDGAGQITEFNRAAEATFGYDRQEVIGESLAEVIIPYSMRERHRLGLVNFHATGEGPVLGRRIEVNALRRDGVEFPVELTVTRVADTEPPLFNGYVRDVTSRRKADEDLAAGRERLAHIARTLQTSLLPPALPNIDGVEVAAAFRALGDGYEVGGDFYDAFELGGGKWAFSLGDVCGKGSEAAVVTALARYTLRAAAMRNRNPAAVLATLNEAIHRQYPDQFCTAVFATLDPSSGAVEMALGGHPRPLLLSAAGEVAPKGTTRPLLGPFGYWNGSTDTFVLDAGDTLFLYSDGVTEARSGRAFFGEDRLLATVRSATGLPVASAVQLIEARVLEFAGELSDDLAVLAVRRIG
ncbi:MAG: PP2C family protein-serine/threonine phosphatase [Acidimicrobiales bacterium]